MDSPFVQSSVALSPVQSPVALPSIQPSVALFTAQTPFVNFNFEDQPTEPIVIDIDEETPLSSPSPQPSDIVDLSLIDQGRSVALDEYVPIYAYLLTVKIFFMHSQINITHTQSQQLFI